MTAILAFTLFHATGLFPYLLKFHHIDTYLYLLSLNTFLPVRKLVLTGSMSWHEYISTNDALKL